VALVKSVTDTRPEEVLSKLVQSTTDLSMTISTHNMETVKATHTCKLLGEIIKDLMTYQTILIDEGQFIGDICEASEILAASGKTVIIAALDTDFRMKHWDSMIRLAPDEMEKLSSLCHFWVFFKSGR
jgi:thymidine kinase